MFAFSESAIARIRRYNLKLAGSKNFCTSSQEKGASQSVPLKHAKLKLQLISVLAREISLLPPFESLRSILSRTPETKPMTHSLPRTSRALRYSIYLGLTRFACC